MKMKELENRSGVSRETIRFYIKKGLLPEPEKPKPNVAVYSEDHIQRLALIKALQEERFLPLDVIKSLIDNQGTEGLPDTGSLTGLEFALASRFGIKSKYQELQPLIDELKLSMDEVRGFQDLGVIDIHEKADGSYISNQDSHILNLWSRAKSVGFNESFDYDFRIINYYQEAASNLAQIMTDLFFARTENKSASDEAFKMAEIGVQLGNEIFPILFNKAIVREVASHNAAAIDKTDNKGNHKLVTDKKTG